MRLNILFPKGTADSLRKTFNAVLMVYLLLKPFRRSTPFCALRSIDPCGIPLFKALDHIAEKPQYNLYFLNRAFS
jgi:hypothetical protein